MQGHKAALMRDQWRLRRFCIAPTAFGMSLSLRPQRYNSIHKDPGLPALSTRLKGLSGYYLPTFHHPDWIAITLSSLVKWGHLGSSGKELVRKKAHTLVRSTAGIWTWETCSSVLMSFLKCLSKTDLDAAVSLDGILIIESCSKLLYCV